MKPRSVPSQVGGLTNICLGTRLGHPVPDSTLVSELNSGVSHQMHRYNPLSWRFSIALSKAFLFQIGLLGCQR
jgi:hypothetical protein